MVSLDASAVATLLVELGRRTALAGDNYFRAKAYQRAADRLSALVEPLDRVIAENRLRELSGIGETIADIVFPKPLISGFGVPPSDLQKQSDQHWLIRCECVRRASLLG